jgi:hypothetical protein
VTGVGQQRERAGEPATDRLDDGVAAGECQRPRQSAQRRRPGRHLVIAGITIVRMQMIVVAVVVVVKAHRGS